MKILKPNVEIWKQGDDDISVKEHVCKCSQTAYRSEPKKGKNAELFYDALIHSGHVSCLRHESCYYIIPMDFIDICDAIINWDNGYNPYIEIQVNTEKTHIYVATNGNFVLDNIDYFTILKEYKVSESEFAKTEVGKTMMRYTLFITTSIDISREYNRRSPNNITEESTIYCNYSKEKFGNEIIIGGSEAFDYVDNINLLNSITKNIDNLSEYNNDELYNAVFLFSEKIYMELTKNRGIKSDAARKVLPLATKTGVVYTYSLKEWSHILRLRYLNNTGKDHFDSNHLGELIYNEFKKLGYELKDGELTIK